MQYTGHSEYSESDPPTCACVGDSGGIASWQTMERRLAALEKLGIPTEFHVYAGLPHGFGLGTGTVAEGWIEDAAAFWEDQFLTSGTTDYRGFTVDNVLHAGKDGDIHYSVHIPESYDGSRPYALYLTLPGYEGLYFQGVAANLHSENFGFEAQKYREDMVVVAPQLSDWGGDLRQSDHRPGGVFPEALQHRSVPGLRQRLLRLRQSLRRGRGHHGLALLPAGEDRPQRDRSGGVGVRAGGLHPARPAPGNP